MSPMAKSVKVIWRKLGRERAWGQATTDPASPLIEIDPRLGAKRQLEVLCHEALHIAAPELVGDKGEAEIDRLGKRVSEVLWAEGYRRVLLDKNTHPPKIS
jgi:hypothetical protein